MQAVAHGRVAPSPRAGGARRRAPVLVADCVVPSSFTNPNNLSIVTGAPPVGARHLRQLPVRRRLRDRGDDERPEVAARADHPGRPRRRRPVAGRDHGQGQAAHSCSATACKRHLLPRPRRPASSDRLAENGIRADVARARRHAGAFDVYSAELSQFVFAAGLKLMHTRRPDAMYLSTTDYVQHKLAPGQTPAPNAFYRDDGQATSAKLDSLGCVVALTADHGMNAKTRLDSQPRRDLPAGRVRR